MRSMRSSPRAATLWRTARAAAARTGLVLRAWRMRPAEFDAHKAADSVAERWPLVDDYESSFTTFLADN